MNGKSAGEGKRLKPKQVGKPFEEEGRAGKRAAVEKAAEDKMPAQVPVYLAVLLLILGIAIGFTVKTVLTPPAVVGGKCEPIIPVEKKVQVKLLYSSSCTACEKDNTLLASFDVKGVPFELEEVDIDETPGIVKEFDVELLPTLLIEKESLNSLTAFGEVRAIIRANFKEVKGYYVAPESFLDSKPHNVLFLQPREGIEPREGIVRIDFFADFMDAASYLAFKSLKGLREEFSGEMEFHFRHFTVNGSDSERIALAAECARDFNKFEEFATAIFEKRFNSTPPAATETPFQLKTTGDEVGIEEQWEFRVCIDQQKKLDIAGMLDGRDAGAVKEYRLAWIPAIVVDGSFVTGFEGLKESICSLKPELGACVEA